MTGGFRPRAASLTPLFYFYDFKFIFSVTEKQTIKIKCLSTQRKNNLNLKSTSSGMFQLIPSSLNETMTFHDTNFEV